MVRLDALAKLLDNQFRIPGTQMRFGFDGIIGLIPYVGDMAGFLVSGLLFSIMMRRGAGPLIMVQMMGNFTLDALVGIVPLAGDLFDFGFKANRRNVDLLKKYYADGKKRPHIGWSLGFFGLLLLGLMGLMVWVVWKVAAVMVSLVMG